MFPEQIQDLYLIGAIWLVQEIIVLYFSSKEKTVSCFSNIFYQLLLHVSLESSALSDLQ